tara:strand:+ start:1609 stop:2118 length:510 start_codon:yes stop_codon:yes gene_type:complete
MPTICELQIQAKKKGLKGYSKMKKSELEAFVKNGESKPRKANKPTFKNVTSQKPLLIKMSSSNNASSNAPPPLSNKKLTEIYKIILSLEKTIKDNVNQAEVSKSKKILEKMKIAFRFVRKKFMDKISNASKSVLLEMSNDIIKQINATKDEDELKILGGQLSEIKKIVN